MKTLTEPLPHLADNPGIRAHSMAENPSDSLTQRYVVFGKHDDTDQSEGWLGLHSFADLRSMADYLFGEHNFTKYPHIRIFDNHSNSWVGA